MLLTLGSFVLVLGVLIFVHELGHFIAAKAVGIAVPRFSIGFGPATPFKFQWGETEYRVAWIPLGGYVKMASHEEQEAMESLEGSLDQEYPPDRLFENKPLAARILVISAGVVMNVVFAWLGYAALAAAYGRVEDPTTAIAYVDSSKLPAEAKALAGVPFGAQVLRVNGDTVNSWQAIEAAITDPTSERLRFDFAGGLDPVILAVPGTRAEARVAILEAIEPLWEPRVGQVGAGQPAQKAGIEPGDLIVSADGDTLPAWGDLVRAVEASAGRPLDLLVQRGDSLLDIAVVPEEQAVQDPVSGETRQAGRIGIGPAIEPVYVRFGLGGAAVEGVRETWDKASLVLFTLKKMVLLQVSPRELGGPIFIGQASGQFARLGASALLGFMAFLSVNLAILNLLPIPVLDGGHLVFLLIEGVRGRPLSLSLRLRLTQLGLFVLLGIMVFALTNDLLRALG